MKSENNDIEPEEGFRFEMILWFLNFHRRYIFGALLLAGVAYFLIHFSQPSPTIEDYPTGTSASRSRPASGAFEEASGGFAEENGNASIEPLAPMSLDEEIDQLLNTADGLDELADSAAIAFLKKRLAKLRELLPQDLAQSQRKYCESQFIDCVWKLNIIANKTDAGVEGVDELMTEVEQAYGNSEDSDIAAAANIVFLRHKVSQFLISQSEEDFEVFKEALKERQAVILKSAGPSENLSRMLSEAVVIAGDDSRLREVAIDHMSNVVNLRMPVALELATNLFFSQVDLQTLPKRIMDRDPDADIEFDYVVRQLEKYPNMPIQIYSIAASSVARYQDVGQRDKAERGIQQFREIAPTITNEGIREELLGVIKQFESAAKPDN